MDMGCSVVFPMRSPLPSSLGRFVYHFILGFSFEELYAKVADDSNLEAVKAIFNDAPPDQRAALLKQQNSNDCVRCL